MEQKKRSAFGRREAFGARKPGHVQPGKLLGGFAVFLALPVAGFLVIYFILGKTASSGQLTSSDQPNFSQQFDWCSGKDSPTPKMQIAGCSGLIESGRGNQKGLSEAFYNRGNAYAASGDFDRAIADYDQAIRLNPNMAAAFGNRGHAYQEKKQIQNALADYDQAIRLNPGAVVALHNRCWARVVIGHLNDALSDCTESLRIRPDNAGTLSTRGFAYLKVGAPDKAIADFDAALKSNPKMAAALYGRGLAKRKQDKTGGEIDIAAAKAIDAGIADQYASLGLQ